MFDKSNNINSYVYFRMTIESTALQWLADISDGDARIALGNLQIVIQDNSDKKGKIISIGDIKEGVKVC